ASDDCRVEVNDRPAKEGNGRAHSAAQRAGRANPESQHATGGKQASGASRQLRTIRLRYQHNRISLGWAHAPDVRSGNRIHTQFCVFPKTYTVAKIQRL